MGEFCIFWVSSLVSRILLPNWQQQFIWSFSRPQDLASLSSLHQSTDLHRGKDLAVAFLPSDRIIPEGTLCLSALASLFAPRGLPRQALPATIPTPSEDRVRCVRTFLSDYNVGVVARKRNLPLFYPICIYFANMVYYPRNRNLKGDLAC